MNFDHFAVSDNTSLKNIKEGPEFLKSTSEIHFLHTWTFSSFFQNMHFLWNNIKYNKINYIVISSLGQTIANQTKEMDEFEASLDQLESKLTKR